MSPERREPHAIVAVVHVPFDFQTEYENALHGEVLPGLHTRFVSIDTLIKMKEAADRSRDRDDIQHLRWIAEDENREYDFRSYDRTARAFNGSANAAKRLKAT